MRSSDRKTNGTFPQKTQVIREQLWLNYFNETLYAKGVITEEQRSRMRSRIINRTGK